MKLTFSGSSWDEYLHWQRHDPKILDRLNVIIRDTFRSPFDGIGKPEPLRGDFKGWWSRRINAEHRLVYRVRGTAPNRELEILGCRFHYHK